MAAHETWRDVVTGDIVSARLDAESAASGMIVLGMAATAGTVEAGTVEAGVGWTRIGIVVRPEDVGLPQLRSPVVFLADGSVGELLPTLRARISVELEIIAGPETSHEAVIAALAEATAATDVHPVDEVGAAVLDQLGAARNTEPPTTGPPTTGPGADEPGFRARGLFGRVSAAFEESPQAEIFARRCPLDGNKLPCVLHSYDTYV